MTADTVIVRVRPGEVRIARRSPKGRLLDFALYRTQSDGATAQAGDVYLGRVKKVVPALEAAFVDIGAAREGFLGLSDARPQQHTNATAVRDRIADYVHEGEAVMVQVLAEARDDKGPKLSRRVSVAGALCVLTPDDPGIRVSKRVADDVERNRLRAQFAGKLESAMGCVVRSSAAGVTDHVLNGEINLLRARWWEIQERARTATAPAKLTAADLIPIQYLTETGMAGLGLVVVDDGALAGQLAQELDKLGATPPDGVKRHGGTGDVFEAWGVADAVDALMEAHVPLRSGGSLIIEETAALTAIDVNAGGAARGRGADLALTTNLEAVEEAARQMRLRNLGGLIVIDLMAVRGEGAMGRVVNAMKDALAHDPAGPHVLGTTKAGLLEITRPRRRPPLSKVLLGPCPVCGTAHAPAPLATGLKALDRVLAEVWAQPALVPALSAPADVIRALRDQARDALLDVEAKLGHTLELNIDDTLAPGTFRVDPATD